MALEDIYRGKVSKLALQKTVICPGCDGRGGKEGAVKSCSSCGGAGVKIITRPMGPMIQRFQSECPDCHGEGEIIKDKDRCKQCSGKKTVVERKVLHIHVDKGVKSGHKIDFRGEGDQLPGMEPGDVQFEIEQKPHARFQRKNDDLFYQAEVDLLTALAGGEINVEHLDDRWLTIKIQAGEPITPGKRFQPQDGSARSHPNAALGQVKMIRGQGMPSFRHHDFGNLYVKFAIKFPAGQEMQNLDLLEKAFPPRQSQIQPPSDAMIEDYGLEDVELRGQARAQGTTELDDDEEDGVPHGAERVQCASQ